jgi:hypothetical protein
MFLKFSQGSASFGEKLMKFLLVLLLTATAIGCGGYSAPGGGGGGSVANITALTPNSQTAGTAFTLTVDGANLTTGSVIYWGTTPLTTNSGGYLSGNVSASITSAMDAAPGMVTVYVHTSAGNSNPLTFTVN